MKIAVGTVVYPSVLPFWHNFIQSIRNQTFRDFHLFIINDGCTIEDLINCPPDTTVHEGLANIAKNRQLLINLIYNSGYDVIIFVDSDDEFQANRFELNVKLGQNFDIVANDMNILSGNHIEEYNIFSQNLKNNQNIDLKFILNKNIFGLSNTACHTNLLNNIVIPEDIIAVDWFLFTKVLLSKANAIFTNKTCTNYRQWEHNSIGFTKNSLDAVKTGIKVKYFHYKNLLDEHEYYMNNFHWIEYLYNNLDSDIFFCTYFEKYIKNKPKSPFWWEQIIEPENSVN